MREMFPSNRKSDKPVVLVSEGANGRFQQRREALERPIDMSRFAWILLLLQLAAALFRRRSSRVRWGASMRISSDSTGGGFARESFRSCRSKGCGSACSIASRPVRIQSFPIRQDGFRFADLASPARLRFDPPECDWPTIRSASPCSRAKSSGSPGPAPPWERSGLTWWYDVMQRFMPSVADALYVKREVRFPSCSRCVGSGQQNGGVGQWPAWLGHPFLGELALLSFMN